jgi:hypothetical protein
MGYSKESVGCLAVRQSDDTSFHPIAHDCPTEDGLVSLISCHVVELIRGSFAYQGPRHDNDGKRVLVAR